MSRQVHPVLAAVLAAVVVVAGVWAAVTAGDTTQVVVVVTPSTAPPTPGTTSTAPSTTTTAAAPPSTADRLGPFLADQFPRTDPTAARQAVEETCAALGAGSDPLTGPAATAGLLPMAYPDLARFGVSWLCPQHAAALELVVPRPPG